MENILFSFVIPVYNNERYIKSAVDSILCQDCECYEIVIVDDGSTDNTSQIVDEIAKNNSVVSVIHQKNQWIYASFNNGIRQATGEYVYILNSDDKLSPNAVKIMKSAVERYNHPDVIWTKVISYNCDDNQNKKSSNSERIDAMIDKEIYCCSAKEVRQLWPYLTISSLAWNQANLYKRELMKEHPFRNDVYGADTLFNISIAPYINSSVVLKECIYEFHIYNKPEMNTSVNKYYPYEHDMFNEIYLSLKKLMQEWNIDENEYLPWLKKTRRSQFTYELKNMQSDKCPLTIEEKLTEICEHYLDDIIVEVGDDWEEMESRTLSGLREIFLKEIPDKDSKYYFLYKLLLALLSYEKQPQDYEDIESAIKNKLNKKHLGESFYNQLTVR